MTEVERQIIFILTGVTQILLWMLHSFPRPQPKTLFDCYMGGFFWALLAIAACFPINIAMIPVLVMMIWREEDRLKGRY